MKQFDVSNMGETANRSHMKRTIHQELMEQKSDTAGCTVMDLFAANRGRKGVYKSIDINVVMSSGSNESVTPLIQSVDKKGLVSISSELSNFSAKILDGSLQNEQPQIGTFTFSSLGMYGVKNVINIITPPQSCCLGVGAIQERVIPDESDVGYRLANVISVTLSCDHRVIDGAVGAQWLQHFKKFLEKPHTMLL
ncbi:DLAT [Nymphon striatum]|nr:DLAT [Nymphon striatum]